MTANRAASIRTRLGEAFAEDATKQVQWKAFLRKNKLDAMDLAEVVRYIRRRALQCGFAEA